MQSGRAGARPSNGADAGVGQRRCFGRALLLQRRFPQAF